MKTVEVKTKEEAVKVVAESIKNGIYAIATTMNGETILGVNSFYGNDGRSWGSIFDESECQSAFGLGNLWLKECYEHPEMFDKCDNLTDDEYRKLAKEQLNDEEYNKSLAAWNDYASETSNKNRLVF